MSTFRLFMNSINSKIVSVHPRYVCWNNIREIFDSFYFHQQQQHQKQKVTNWSKQQQSFYNMQQLIISTRKSSNSTILSNELDHDGFPKAMTPETRELAKSFLSPSVWTTKPASIIPTTEQKETSKNENNNDIKELLEQQQQQIMWKKRLALSKTITLIESSNPKHHEQAALLMTYLLQQQQQQQQSHEQQFQELSPSSYFRVGIAGPPGAGKSSLIEALGKYVLELNNVNNNNIEKTKENDSIASKEETCRTLSKTETNDDIWIPGTLSVLCIDPSSVTTGGSIMGDKTRMMDLSRNVHAFVRPSPTKGIWGGVAPRTDDVIRIIGASNVFPLIIIETVGLGQSELEIQQCVDMLILAVPPGGGDSLQGVKKGIVEIADTIIVTKADGNLLTTARHTAADYRGAVQFLNVITDKQKNDDDNATTCTTTTPILLVSSVTGDGLSELWKNISLFRKQQIRNGQIQMKRQKQDQYWMWKNLRTLVKNEINDNMKLQEFAKHVNEELANRRIPPRVAASLLFENILHDRSNNNGSNNTG